MKIAAALLFAALSVQGPARDSVGLADSRAKSCTGQGAYSSPEYGSYSPLASNLPTI